MRKKPDGSMTQTYLEQQQVWLRQFSQIEAGLETTWQQLYTQHLYRLKRDKVPGPNLTPGVMEAGGEVLSRQLSIILFAKC